MEPFTVDNLIVLKSSLNYTADGRIATHVGLIDRGAQVKTVSAGRPDTPT